ncbi:MAG: SH3 domain-containing protein, partial [Bacteroidetes bacterium]
SKQKDLLALSYTEFMLRVFARDARTEVEVSKVRVDSRRHYQISYACWRSLDEGLKQRGLPVPEPLSQAQQETYEFSYPKPFFQTPSGVFDAFMARLQETHHLPAEALSPDNQQRLKRKLWINGLTQGLGRGLLEWVAAVPLVLPILLGAGLLGLTNAEGVPLLGQYAVNTGLGAYFEDAEAFGQQVGGLYLWPVLCLGIYLLALIPRIWTGPKLQLIGKTAAHTSPLLSIRGGTGFLFLLWMLLMPVFLALSNWMFEGLAFGFLLIIGLQMNRLAKGRNQQARNNGKWRVIGWLLIGAAMARLGLELLENGEDFNSEVAAYGRGGVDILFYLLAGLVFFFPPIYAQLFRVHHRLRYGLKVLLLTAGGLLILFGLPGSPGQRDIDLTNLSLDWPSGPAPAPDPVIPDVYLARISDGYAGINLRAGQGSNYGIIRVIQEGERFLVETDPSTGWWRVTTGTGEVGYMHNSKIKREREAVESDRRRFPAFRAGAYEEDVLPEDEPPAPAVVVVEPEPEPTPEPPRPQPSLGERELPDPTVARLSRRELGRLMQRELSRLADPSVARNERRALERELLRYFQDPD